MIFTKADRERLERIDKNLIQAISDSNVAATGRKEFFEALVSKLDILAVNQVEVCNGIDNILRGHVALEAKLDVIRAERGDDREFMENLGIDLAEKIGKQAEYTERLYHAKKRAKGGKHGTSRVSGRVIAEGTPRTDLASMPRRRIRPD